MGVARIQYPMWLADKGSLPNAEGWLEVLNLIPTGVEQWMTEAQLEKRLTLADAGDVLGYHWNAQNGVNGELLYIGTSTTIRTVEPSDWSQTTIVTVFPQRVVTAWQYDDSGASYVDITANLLSFLHKPITAQDETSYDNSPTTEGTFVGGTGHRFILVDAQDETSYDNSPTTEGTFVGGTGHVVSDVLTLSDGSTVTVDAVAGGVVTQFTVALGESTTGFAAGATLTQTGSTGSGIGFSLSPDTDNSVVPVITLSDGTTVTVDSMTVAGGVVTQFTVDSSASTGFLAGATLSQISTTAVGLGFSLTPGEDNHGDGVNVVSPFPAGAGVDDIAYFGFLAPPISPLTFAVDTLALLTTGQDETNYPGRFSGGSGHVVSDVVTLSDGSTITVDAVDGGVVTEFTVDASGGSGFSPPATLTQTGTTGSGTGFSLTPVLGNYNNGTYTIAWEYWNGSSWVALPGVVDGTSSLRVDGTVAFTSLDGLTTRTVVNGSASLHWIRAKRDGGTVPTDPIVNYVLDSSSVDANIGWQFAGYGGHEFAVAGHEAPCLLRLNGAGLFNLAITNAEPVPEGGTATGNWPPKAKYCAVWGDGVVIANLTDVGPANAFGNTCGFLWWLSADSGSGGANVFSIVDGEVAVPGGGTTYDYVADEHGDITGLAGGAHFGALFKPSATYRVEYYAGEWIVHVENVSERYGTRYHNSIVVADDEIYYMSDEGPAVLRRSGPPQLLGEGQILRALFDPSWVIGTDYTFSTTVVPYLVYGIYFPVQDIVSWHYRHEEDEMDFVLNYHRSTGRWSICKKSTVYSTGSGAEPATLLAAGVRPRLASTRYSSAQGAVYIAEAGKVFEAVPAGTYRWQHQPKLLTPYLIHSRTDDEEPQLVRPRSILTYYELRAGVTIAPQLEWTINQKVKLGTNQLARSETVSVEGDDGRHQFSDLLETVWQQYELKIGNTNLDAVSDLANIAGFEVMYSEGGEL